ncbi:MAG: GH3 auxin-responsive promoter family protein, partial [Gammaproteobacteria bacterium]|nr:GH3 auxin-responsive promoter family protein [Gammaproteobacteria bacterium]
MKKLYKNWHKQSANFVAKCLSARAAFLAALADPVVAQKQVLDNIIAKNLGTKFAEAHFFTQIKTVKDFQKAVPIRSYEQFESWIEQEINQKGGVLASDKPARWLKTSGSTGNSKKIPYSKYWMEEYRTPALEVLWGNYIHYTPELLAHPFAALDTQTVREVPTEFLNGIPYQGITNRNSPLSATDWQPPWYDAPWFTADVPSDYDAKMYYRLRYFLEQDLRAILAINPSTLIAFKHHLMKNLPQLIDDIHDGTIKGKKISQPNQGIAKKITDIVQQPEFSFKDIWPNLDLISCWTSASAKLYIPKLQKLFPGVKLLPFMSC